MPLCAQVTDAGLGALADLPHLAALDLSGIVRVSDAGLLELQALPGLRRLNVGGCFVTAGGVGMLMARLPRLHIAFQARSNVFTWATDGCHHQEPPDSTCWQ